MNTHARWGARVAAVSAAVALVSALAVAVPAAATPDHFTFTLKAPRRITHDAKLQLEQTRLQVDDILVVDVLTPEDGTS